MNAKHSKRGSATKHPPEEIAALLECKKIASDIVSIMRQQGDPGPSDKLRALYTQEHLETEELCSHCNRYFWTPLLPNCERAAADRVSKAMVCEIQKLIRERL